MALSAKATCLVHAHVGHRGDCSYCEYADNQATIAEQKEELKELRALAWMTWCMSHQWERYDDDDRQLFLRANCPTMMELDRYFYNHPWTEDDNTVRAADRGEI